MHYRHRFHAGNFADVFKHVLLCALIESLRHKDTPWCFLDTHAGAGLYDLKSADAQRTGEWCEGIARLAGVVDPPGPIATYLRLQARVRDQFEGEASGRTPVARRAYAGSPLLAALLARPGDQVLACESAPEVAEQLKDSLAAIDGAGRHAVHVRDGYRAEALLPPAQKRGLVLIDPPFERADEFDAVSDLLAHCLARFGHGVYALWYPVKKHWDTARFLRRCARGAARPAVNFTIDTGGPADGSMRACGLLVVNPPYRLAEALDPTLRRLAELLAQGETATATSAPMTPDMKTETQPARRPNDPSRTRPSR